MPALHGRFEVALRDCFAYVLPLVESDREAAVYVADRLRQVIQLRSVNSRGEDLRYTVSIGVAQFAGKRDTQDDLLRRADEALYAAKKGGRNRVEQA